MVPNGSFKIVFDESFADRAEELIANLRKLSFLEELAGVDNPNTMLSDFGVQIEADDVRAVLVPEGLSDSERRDHLGELVAYLSRVEITTKNPREPLSWCRLAAIASAATEAAPSP